MRWKWRPSTEPPLFSRLLLALVVPPADRRFVLSDLQEELEERIERDGPVPARRWYREQARLSLGPCLAHLTRLLLRGRGRADGDAVPLTWQPSPAVTAAMLGDNAMSEFLNDTKVVFRNLRKNPVVTAVAVASLALGISVVTSVFTIVNAFVLRPPVTGAPLPENLVTVYTSEGDGDLYGETSFPDYESLRTEVKAFDDAAAFRIGVVTLEEGGTPDRLMVEIVTGNYFDVLGIRPLLGRGFRPEETPVGSARRLIVLSHGLWQERFGGDPGILGRTLRVDGHLFTVIGVAPKGLNSRFIGLKVDAWVPLGMPGRTYKVTPHKLADRSDRQYAVIARVDEEASHVQVDLELSLLAERLHAEYPEDWEDERRQARSFVALPEADSRVPPDARAALGAAAGLLFAAAGLILFIACSNVASLFLARAYQRRREMAVRLAVGASRRRLVGMLLIESLVPALVAGGLGVLLSMVTVRWMDSVPMPMGFPLRFDFSLDHRVLGFAVLVSLLASVLFGLAPALEGSRPDLVSSLKSDDRSGGRPRRVRVRRLLVVGQVAASLIFVVGAGLALRSLQEATTFDSGLEVDRIALMSKLVPEESFSPEAAAQILDEIAERLAALPDVESVGLSRGAEMTILGEMNRAEISVAGIDSEEASPLIFYNAVTPGYLEMLGIPLHRGRTFRESDGRGAPRVAVVTEAFVHRFWPGEDGLGKQFRITGRKTSEELERETDAPMYEVIGIAADGRYAGFDVGEEPYLWTSLRQEHASLVMIHLRGRTAAGPMAAHLRDEVELLQGEVVLVEPTTYREMLDLNLLGYRLSSKFLGWGGVFGIVLAVIGIYGLVAFSVSLRSREMAIRQALGARPSEVVGLVAREGTSLALWGLAVGLAVVLPLARLVRSDLFGVSPVDPVAVGGGCLLLLVAAVTASLVPARRVADVDPMAALHEE